MIITSSDFGGRDTQALPLRSLSRWLGTIRPCMVLPEARPMLTAFPREALGVMSRSFLAPPSPVTRPAEGAPGTSSAIAKEIEDRKRLLTDPQIAIAEGSPVFVAVKKKFANGHPAFAENFAAPEDAHLAIAGGSPGGSNHQMASAEGSMAFGGPRSRSTSSARRPREPRHVPRGPSRTFRWRARMTTWRSTTRARCPREPRHVRSWRSSTRRCRVRTAPRPSRTPPWPSRTPKR